MATKIGPFTWENGFRQPLTGSHVRKESPDDEDGLDLSGAYVMPPSLDLVTSPTHNDLGVNTIRDWPTIYNGTNSPHGIPDWWKPKEEVDVLICGAGPSGLEVAVSLARQGVSFRILDKADTALVAGRADGVQPRFLETVATWGLATEIHEEGPLIERTAIYKDGKKVLFQRSHQSDSRYRGLHIITQGQIERIYIRDLLRHKAIVERGCTITKFHVESNGSTPYPVQATIRNASTGEECLVKAKYLVGSDGAASTIRKSLGIPFEGVSTDIYWGIMDCKFDSDYPHAWIFGSVISSKHGGCVIIPREEGYIRLYTQLDISHTGPIAQSRLANDPAFAESGGKVEVHSITPNEVLAQANRIFSPYKLNFAAPLSWFAVWKISERVARSYSSPDMHVHLVGDAAHVHSVMGAFGLNASILDAANLSWKLGLAVKGAARADELLGTYTSERRKHAARIIEVSGTYLRFVCGSSILVPNLHNGADPERQQSLDASQTNGVSKLGEIRSGDESDTLGFLGEFFKNHGQFLLGVDCAYDNSILAPAQRETTKGQPAVRVKNGVRAPNPRLCFSSKETGYLYDKFSGPPRFHIVIFGSSLTGVEVCRRVGAFLTDLNKPASFYSLFGGADRFNIILVVKKLPFEWDDASTTRDMLVKLALPKEATILFDDRSPEEDAHTMWGVNRVTGGIAVIRPDLWVSMTAFPDEIELVNKYFQGFLL